MRPEVRKARLLALKAHEGQVDKAGTPVFFHVERVAQKVFTTRQKVLAYLHDMVEDTNWTLEELLAFFSEDIVLDVEALTRRSGQTYNDYLERVVRMGSSDAVAVKLADLEDHLDRRSDIPESLVSRYEKARERLLAGR